MNEFNGNPMDPTQSAWGLFALTGGVGYYLLYKELIGGHDAERRDKSFD